MLEGGAACAPTMEGDGVAAGVGLPMALPPVVEEAAGPLLLLGAEPAAPAAEEALGGGCDEDMPLLANGAELCDMVCAANAKCLTKKLSCRNDCT